MKHAVSLPCPQQPILEPLVHNLPHNSRLLISDVRIHGSQFYFGKKACCENDSCDPQILLLKSLPLFWIQSILLSARHSPKKHKKIIFLGVNFMTFLCFPFNVGCSRWNKSVKSRYFSYSYVMLSFFKVIFNSITSLLLVICTNITQTPHYVLQSVAVWKREHNVSNKWSDS
jgi:hypothetical protein